MIGYWYGYGIGGTASMDIIIPWILSSGVWNDQGVWKDNEFWID